MFFVVLALKSLILHGFCMMLALEIPFWTVFAAFWTETFVFAWYLHGFGTWNSISNGICSILEWNYCFISYLHGWEFEVNFERHLQHFGMKPVVLQFCMIFVVVWIKFMICDVFLCHLNLKSRMLHNVCHVLDQHLRKIVVFYKKKLNMLHRIEWLCMVCQVLWIQPRTFYDVVVVVEVFFFVLVLVPFFFFFFLFLFLFLFLLLLLSSSSS